MLKERKQISYVISIPAIRYFTGLTRQYSFIY
jgi:hypothetical protein